MFSKEEARNMVALINRGLKAEPLSGIGDVFAIANLVKKLNDIIEAQDGEDVPTGNK